MLAQIVNGLLTGGQYALAAIGLSFMLGTARVFNFAYGAFFVLATFTTATLMSGALSLPYGLAAVGTVIILAGLSYPFTRVAVLPVVRRAEDAVLIATLAVGIIITNLALEYFGGEVTTIDSPLSSQRFEIAGAVVSAQQILGFGAAIAVAAVLSLYLRRTVAGSRIRAVAHHPTLAAASGINVPRVYVMAVVVGTAIVGLTGALYGPTGIVSVFAGDHLLLRAFTVAALAGMGQIWGAVAVGLSVGIAESAFSATVSPAYASAFVYALLIAVLLFFPRGVFRGE